jgi:hypothetical protein
MIRRISAPPFVLACILMLLASVASAQSGGGKRKVQNADDLPRFTYPVKGTASGLLQADAATFNQFTEKLRTDLESILRDYDIADKAT